MNNCGRLSQSLLCAQRWPIVQSIFLNRIHRHILVPIRSGGLSIRMAVGKPKHRYEVRPTSSESQKFPLKVQSYSKKCSLASEIPFGTVIAIFVIRVFHHRHLGAIDVSRNKSQLKTRNCQQTSGSHSNKHRRVRWIAGIR